MDAQLNEIVFLQAQCAAAKDKCMQMNIGPSQTFHFFSHRNTALILYCICFLLKTVASQVEAHNHKECVCYNFSSPGIT